MSKSKHGTEPAAQARQLPKSSSGIAGLDEVTGGGLPRGRPTLVCGGAGCGKTLFAVEFMVRGATLHGEPGVFMSFEENETELAANVASLGFDLPRLEAEKKLAIDHVQIDRAEIEETGEFDLEGLFVRLEHAIESVGAKRVVLDTIESLFSALPNPAVLRSELRRLFRWLKDRGQTVVITGEKGEGTLTRQGLEEYVSDCVIFLDHRVTEQVSTRRLRVVKYRGSIHGTNEYPFLIDAQGISVLPITSLGLEYEAPTERVSTGISRLDEMLGGKGCFKGSSILVSGSAGTGKTSLAAYLARAACERGDRCVFFAFEESQNQVLRNMRSIGIDLEPCVRKGLLRIVAGRPYAHGLELHLVTMYKAVKEFSPSVVIVDPISNLVGVGSNVETRAMLTRLIDFLKSQNITTLFTNLTSGVELIEHTDVGISSLIDTWLMLEMVLSGGERNRLLSIVKARGMQHSNQAVEYRLSEAGMRFADTYLGPSGVLTGSARVAKEAQDRALAAAHANDIVRQQALRDSRRRTFEARLVALREEFAAEDAESERAIREATRNRDLAETDRSRMGDARHAFTGEKHGKNGAGQRSPRTGKERR